MDDREQVSHALRSFFNESARLAIPDDVTILSAVRARVGSHRTQRAPRLRPLLAIPVVILALIAGGLAVVASPGSAAIQFAFHLMPGVAPHVAPPPAKLTLSCRPPENTTVAEARRELLFPVFSLARDSQASLVSSQFVYGCDNSKGVILVYQVGTTALQVAEGKAPSASGPYVLNLKAGKTGVTPAELGWSTVEIAGNQVAVHTSPASRYGNGGIDEAVWQTGGTVVTVGVTSLTPGTPPSSPFSLQRLQEVVTYLSSSASG